jgi:hypothetical protein
MFGGSIRGKLEFPSTRAFKTAIKTIVNFQKYNILPLFLTLLP